MFSYTNLGWLTKLRKWRKDDKFEISRALFSFRITVMNNYVLFKQIWIQNVHNLKVQKEFNFKKIEKNFKTVKISKTNANAHSI